ncbi:hypothetical protein C8R45DRAFT_1012991 [Mycena sanguinolenta]|nr:hypothetical protein C8R45DRAFT_1012991 [Mycena sanguinolenta]
MTRFFRSPAPVSCVPLRVDAAGAGTQVSVTRDALRCGFAGRTSCKLMASFVGVGATSYQCKVNGPRAPGHLHDAARCARSPPAPAGVRYVSRLRLLQCAGACCRIQTLAPSSSAPCPHFPPTRPYLQPPSSSPAARASSARWRRDVHCDRGNQVARSLGMRRYI